MCNYFIVSAKCGHVGRNKYIPIDFPVEAENKSEAANIVKNFGRVKKNRKDVILNVQQVDEKIYSKQLIFNDYDPYLHVDTKYKQKIVSQFIIDRLVEDDYSKQIMYSCNRKSVKYRLKKQKLLDDDMLKQIKNGDWYNENN